MPITKNTPKYNAGADGAIATFVAIAFPIIEGGIEFLARARSAINAVINPNINSIYLGLIFLNLFV
jgi:hypothetical protein